jgi:hypothetical protein
MQVYDLHLLIYMLNTANIRIYFVTAKKKREIFA